MHNAQDPIYADMVGRSLESQVIEEGDNARIGRCALENIALQWSLGVYSQHRKPDVKLTSRESDKGDPQYHPGPA